MTYSLCPYDFQVGEPVRFIRSHVDMIRRAHGRRRAPFWLEFTGTITRVETDGWRVMIAMPGCEGAMTVSPAVLERPL